jgi:hypothetical protein
LYVVLLTGCVLVVILKTVVLVDALSTYVVRFGAFVFAAVRAMTGAAPQALLKVIVAMSPVVLPSVPVVTVTKPAVSVPLTETVGVVHAAVFAMIVGAVPPEIMCPLTVILPVTTSFWIVIVMLVVSAVKSAAPL